MQIVAFQNVSRIYINGNHALKALDEMDFSLDEGKFVVIGLSGIGKMHYLICLAVLSAP